MADLRNVLGKRIRNARIQLSLSQRQLAEEMGFSAPQIISQIEKGERQIKAGELVNLAKALHLDVFQLLSADEAKPLAPVVPDKYPGRDTEVIEAEFPLHRR